MRFTGRQLKDLGVPPDRIKYFVDKEYDSPEDLMRAVAEFRADAAEVGRGEGDRPDHPGRPGLCVPSTLETPGLPVVYPVNSTTPSKRELRQWLDDGAVRVNGKFSKAHEYVEFPITDLVYFPGAKRQTTIV